MTDRPESESNAPLETGITVTDPRNAPIVYFEGAPNFGVANGVVNVTLALNRHLANPSGITVDATTLDVATSNFRQLSKLLMDVLYHLHGRQPELEASPQKCLEQVQALPNQADSATPSQKQRGRQRQREADLRRAQKEATPK